MSGYRTIWFVGQGRWARLLADAINRDGTGAFRARSVVLDRAAQSVNALALFCAAHHDVVVRVGFRPGARTWRGRGFDLVWRLLRVFKARTRLAVYWIGTDVLYALRDGRGADVVSCAGSEALHLTNAPWLVDELATIGVAAQFAPIPWVYSDIPVEVTEYPAEFAVATYVPDARRRFYGLAMILEVAKRLPEVTFRVVGGDGAGINEVPPNVQFLGWVQSMDPVYRSSTAVIRMVQHDAISGAVLEGLAYCRPVVYTYEFPWCIHVPFGDSDGLHAAILSLLTRWQQDDLPLNTAGREYVISTFAAGSTARNLEAILNGDGPR